MVGDASIAPPTDAPGILIFIPTQFLEDSRGLLQDRRDNETTFLRVPETASTDGLHPVEGNQHFAGFPVDRI